MGNINPVIKFLLVITIMIAAIFYARQAREKLRNAENRIQKLQQELDETKQELEFEKTSDAGLKEQIDKLNKKIAEQEKIEKQLRKKLQTARYSAKSSRSAAGRNGKFASKQGLVTAILFSKENSSTVIDNYILRKGDKLYEVEIIRIYKDKVEFSSNGQTWTQRIQEAPNKAWFPEEM